MGWRNECKTFWSITLIRPFAILLISLIVNNLLIIQDINERKDKKLFQ